MPSTLPTQISDPREMRLPPPPDVEHGEFATRNSFSIDGRPRKPRVKTRLERRREEIAAVKALLAEGQTVAALAAVVELVEEFIEDLR